ncbi:MAG: hypothetical protein R3D55_25145 [Chloroflexota bacterium]
MQDIPPLTFAGLRYGLAFLCLLPSFGAAAAWLRCASWSGLAGGGCWRWASFITR